MKKISLIATFVFSSMLVLSPLAFAATTDNSTFYYRPQVQWVQANPSGTSPQGIPECGLGTLTSPTILCYSPKFIRAAYDYPSTAVLNGSGQTIVIVDAYGSPTITADLATFDTYFSLPAPPSFTIVCGTGGCPPFNPRDFKHDVAGWGVETSLDVEWAHAMAPLADIVLEVASTSSGNSLNLAVSDAISHYPGSIISQSFGIPEALLKGNNGQILQAHANYVAALVAGDTVLASAGDFGGSNGFGFANAGFPASDPFVTAVGGTMGLPFNATGTLVDCPALTTCTGGLVNFTGFCTHPRLTGPNCTPTVYNHEQVWNEPSTVSVPVATGGAPSILFTSVPGYQSGLGLSSRTIPDVSYNAAIDGGVLVKASFLGGGYFVVGGTSAGSPQWAGIFALVNQARAIASEGPIGFANPTLYGLTLGQKATDFHDITVGWNKLANVLPGFNATAGYDKATGWGTPDVSNLIPDLT